MNFELLKNLEQFLISPNSKKKLVVDKAEMCLTSEDGIEKFPIINGIIDMVPGSFDKVSKAYDNYSDKYDPYVLNEKFSYKVTKLLTWAIKDDFEYSEAVIKLIPDTFSGLLVDIPVGTGIFTAEIFKKLVNSQIICIDYSLEMIKHAKKRFDEEGIRNVLYIRGDANQLPLVDSSIDLLITMSGIECFEDRDKAIQEMTRILKQNGRILGCTHARKINRMKDFFFKITSKFTKLVVYPYYSVEELMKRINEDFKLTHKSFVKSKIIFEGEKKVDILFVNKVRKELKSTFNLFSITIISDMQL